MLLIFAMGLHMISCSYSSLSSNPFDIYNVNKQSRNQVVGGKVKLLCKCGNDEEKN